MLSLKSSQVIILSLMLLFCACSPQPDGVSDEKRNGDYVIKTIDGCEYIEYDFGILDQRVYSLTHKGNCKFCLMRSNKN